MQISAVICTHLRTDYLEGAIESVLAQQPAEAVLEVIVVDNSPDPTALRDLVSKYQGVDRVTLIHTSVIGLSNARNIGAKAARCDIVAYLDDDAVAAPNWARGILDVFERGDPDTAIVGGPVEPIWVEAPPSWLTPRYHEIFSLVDRGDEVRVLGDDEWLAGCNIAFDRETLLAAGGFDQALGRRGDALLSNEETVACDHIRRSGKKMVYTPGALVRHVIPPQRTTVDWVIRRIAWQAISDAVAHPQKSAAHAHVTSRRWGFVARLLRAIRFFNLSNKARTQLSERDYMFIYDVVNQLLCGEHTPKPRP